MKEGVQPYNKEKSDPMHVQDTQRKIFLYNTRFRSSRPLCVLSDPCLVTIGLVPTVSCPAGDWFQLVPIGPSHYSNWLDWFRLVGTRSGHYWGWFQPFEIVGLEHCVPDSGWIRTGWFKLESWLVETSIGATTIIIGPVSNLMELGKKMDG